MKSLIKILLVGIGSITSSYTVVASQPMSPDHFCDSEFSPHYAVLSNDRFSASESVRVWLSEMSVQSGVSAGEPLLQARVRVKIEDREEVGIREQRELAYGRMVGDDIVSQFNMAREKWRHDTDPDTSKSSCSHCVSIEVWTCNDGELSKRLAIGSSPYYDSYRNLFRSYLGGLETTFPGQLEWREEFVERSDLRAKEQKELWDSLPDR